MISAAGAEYFLRMRMATRNGDALSFLAPAVFNEYVRAFTLKTITGTCRDYRAGATCDFEMDTADKDRKITMPALILWGREWRRPQRRVPRYLEKIRHRCERPGAALGSLHAGGS